MSFIASEEVTVSSNKDVESGSCLGVVIKSEADTLQLALRGNGVAVKNGTLIHVKSTKDLTKGAWASVDQIEMAGDVKLLSLKTVRFEADSKVRAARCQVDLTISANFNDRDQNTKRTIGQAVNLSLTGLRARFRTTIPKGTSVHIAIHLAPEKIVEAVAKVMRIVEGSESASGGYELGLEFQRFIRGYEFLMDMAPTGSEYPPEEDISSGSEQVA